tara:strand:- start:15 stop:242 length:228 start_codon:yes stop_codon:yes gene_type:complete
MNSLENKVFFMYCADRGNRKDFFRTVYFKTNPFTGAMVSHVSNATPGSPPPEMPELPPTLRNRVHSINNVLPFNR